LAFAVGSPIGGAEEDEYGSFGTFDAGESLGYAVLVGEGELGDGFAYRGAEIFGGGWEEKCGRDREEDVFRHAGLIIRFGGDEDSCAIGNCPKRRGVSFPRGMIIEETMPVLRVRDAVWSIGLGALVETCAYFALSLTSGSRARSGIYSTVGPHGNPNLVCDSILGAVTRRGARGEFLTPLSESAFDCP